VTDRPGDETNGTDQVIEALKAAFIRGQLAKDEFDQRVAQALAAYAALDALTADIPASAPEPATAPPEVTREAYNRGLVARGTFGGAGAVMLVVFIAVSIASGNPFTGFIFSGVFGAVMVVVLGAISTLLLWALEGVSGRSSRRTPPPQARARAVERQASAGQARQPRRDPGDTAEAARDRHLTRGCSQVWA
jgi:hypothetical protein